MTRERLSEMARDFYYEDRESSESKDLEALTSLLERVAEEARVHADAAWLKQVNLAKAEQREADAKIVENDCWNKWDIASTQGTRIAKAIREAK